MIVHFGVGVRPRAEGSGQAPGLDNLSGRIVPIIEHLPKLPLDETPGQYPADLAQRGLIVNLVTQQRATVPVVEEEVTMIP